MAERRMDGHVDADEAPAAVKGIGADRCAPLKPSPGTRQAEIPKLIQSVG
jgi:hypothetical protein